MSSPAISGPGGATTPTQGTTPTSQSTSSTNSLGGLTASDFLSLMVTQLQNQDPLNPASSNDLLQQTAALSQVEGINQLNTSISQLLSSQQLTQAASLIGKDVTYQATGSNTKQSGTVSAVSMVNGQAQVTVGSATVPLSQVQGVTAA